MHRKTLVVILRNYLLQTHTYASIRDKQLTLHQTPGMSIEFPQMCYVSPCTTSVLVRGGRGGRGGGIALSASTGVELVQAGGEPLLHWRCCIRPPEVLTTG